MMRQCLGSYVTAHTVTIMSHIMAIIAHTESITAHIETVTAHMDPFESTTIALEKGEALFTIIYHVDN